MSKLPSELPPEIVRISWLLGHWEGVGQGQYPNSSNFSFIQQLEFNNDGRPFIDYESKSWELNADGTAGKPLHSEKVFGNQEKVQVLKFQFRTSQEFQKYGQD